MKNSILSILIGALLLFMWNAISWMVLPFHANTLNNIPETSMDRQVLQESLPKDGVYHYPGFPKDDSAKSREMLASKLAEGPRITLMVFKKGGTSLFEVKTFVGNFGLNVMTVLVLLVVVSQMRNKSLKSILTTTTFIGLIVGLTSDLPQMNWYLFPMDYTLVNVLDHLVSFSLVGLLFGLFTFRNETSEGGKK